MLRGLNMASILLTFLIISYPSYALATTWETQDPMPDARFGHVSVAVDKRIYVFGGFDATNQLVSEVLVYDTTNEIWDNNTGLKPQEKPRLYAAASVHKNKIYIFGGYNSSGQSEGIVEIYDPSTNSWDTGGVMDVPRIELTASPASINGYIYVIGGIAWPNTTPLKTVEVYMPDEKKMIANINNELIEHMPTARHNLTCSVVENKIYVFGGQPNFLDVVEIYNTQSNEWKSSERDDEPKPEPMPTGRAYLSSAAVGSDVYAVGGVSSNHSGSLNKVEMYNTASNIWLREIPQLFFSRNYLSATTVGNKIYAIGGVFDSEGAVNHTELFVVPLNPYTCLGFEAPLADGPVRVKKNRAIPVKAQLLEDGYIVTESDITVPPVIEVIYSSAQGLDPIDASEYAYSAGRETDGNQFEYNSDEGKWQFNLKAKNYTAAGTYTIIMKSGDENEYTIDSCTAEFVIEDR